MHNNSIQFNPTSSYYCAGLTVQMTVIMPAQREKQKMKIKTGQIHKNNTQKIWYDT